ncbi:class I SAM-dependent methyltransferase [Actinoplanes siamensis]|uniref:class I SAM-dependent methyltransferase n=1 Tax=Actinoplanes siamensis TaxID=1223317 RepID=UPI001940C0EA|nr:methyltransferase domain-containing protein [Actinoplanes siamensis]
MATLDALRRAFGPASETPLLVDIMAKHFGRPGTISMLDVGIGNGVSARKVAEGLSRNGIHVELTGIDPYLPPSAYQLNWPRKPHLAASGLASFDPGSTYDVVNATQCLYYLGDESAALRKLASLVSPGGILTITVWDDGCTLKKIHDAYLAPGRPSPSGMGVSRALAGVPSLTGPSQVYRFAGTIRLAGNDGTILDAILDIAGRGAGSTGEARLRAKAYLRSLGTTAPRRNAIVTAGRAAEGAGI